MFHPIFPASIDLSHGSSLGYLLRVLLIGRPGQGAELISRGCRRRVHQALRSCRRLGCLGWRFSFRPSSPRRVLEVLHFNRWDGRRDYIVHKGLAIEESWLLHKLSESADLALRAYRLCSPVCLFDFGTALGWELQILARLISSGLEPKQRLKKRWSCHQSNHWCQFSACNWPAASFLNISHLFYQGLEDRLVSNRF